MGCVETISFDRWPRQGKHLGMLVSVCFHYDTSKTVRGRVVRDDAEEPFETLVAIGEGQIVRAVECQYQTLETETDGGEEG